MKGLGSVPGPLGMNTADTASRIHGDAPVVSDVETELSEVCAVIPYHLWYRCKGGGVMIYGGRVGGTAPLRPESLHSNKRSELGCLCRDTHHSASALLTRPPPTHTPPVPTPQPRHIMETRVMVNLLTLGISQECGEWLSSLSSLSGVLLSSVVQSCL